VPTLAELPEQNATGEIAVVYEEIRATYGAPYVSSLQRHLATYPGVLEWAWGIVGPGFHSGLIPKTAWQIAQDADHEPAPVAIDKNHLLDLGVDAPGVATISNIAENFVRVAPLNLLFAGCIRAILEGADLPDGKSQSASVQALPKPLQPMPAMLSPETLSPSLASDLHKLSTHLGDQTFTPGLYRMLVHWPGYLTHVADMIGPRLGQPDFQARCEGIAQRIVSAVPMVLSALPAPSNQSAPDPALVPHIIEATKTYRRTSPEMILVGTVLLKQLRNR
jgi:hypothetical protein